MGNKVDFIRNLDEITDRHLSPALWGAFPVSDLLEDPSLGIFMFDDFRDLPLAPTLTTQIAFGRYKAFANTGCTISKVSPINSVETIGGALAFATDTDNDSASLADAYPSLQLTGSRSTSGKLIFECCIAQKSVATDMASSFVGLGEVEQWTLANGVPLNGGDAITNAASFIGFRVEEDGLGVIDTVVSDRATSFTNIGDTEGGTLTAYTFRKLGFIYDLDRPSAERITFFADNQPLATKYTGANIAATTNLKANGLGRIIATCADSGGAAHELYMKWWAVGQLFPGVNGA